MALVTLHDGNTVHPDCASCPFHDPATKGPRHKPVLGECYAIQPVGVIVGEGPGGEEVTASRPFVGRTGQWLDDRLVENGFHRDQQLAVLNATACQPPKGMKTDTNMGHASKACKPLFDAQYTKYKHLPTLAMGKWATFAVTTKAISIETGRGFVRQSLIATWHPTYAAFYNPWKAGEFVIDLQRFRRLIDGNLEAPPRTIIKPTISDVLAVVRSDDARARGVAVDIETRAPHGAPSHLGKDPTRCELRTIAIGTPNLGVAYWWGSKPSVERAIVKALGDHGLVKIFHNGWFFDLRILARYHVKVNNVIDTRDMRRAVSATSRLSLRYLASVYSDFAPWKEDEK